MAGKFSNYAKHGLTIHKKAPPRAIATNGDQLGLMIGTAPNKHADVEYDVPLKLYSTDDLIQLDTTGDQLGSLYYAAKYFLTYSSAALYVIVVNDSAKAGDEYIAEMKARVIGGMDAGTGQRTGLRAVEDCQEAPTVIGSTLFANDISVINALAPITTQMSCMAVSEFPNTNSVEAKTFADEFGDAHAHIVGCDVSIEMWGVPIPSTAWGMAGMCSVVPWVSPSNKAIVADDVARKIGHRLSDSKAESNELNWYGVTIPVRPKRGGYVFWGNRTVSGAWISSIGLLNTIQRKLELSMETEMDEMMTYDFFKQQVERINNWISDLKAKHCVIHARAYMHQKMNSVNSYESGEWALAIDYGEYSPNEHTQIFLQKDLSITREYVETVKKELS